MSNRRRAPLSNVPNGTNSPHRAGGLIPTIKRSRPAVTQLENASPSEIEKQQQHQHTTTVAPANTREDRENHPHATTATTTTTGPLDPHPTPTTYPATTTTTTAATTTTASTMSAATTMRSSTHQFQAPSSNQTVTRRPTGGVVGGNTAEKASFFTRPSRNSTPNSFERKLAAAKEQSKVDATSSAVVARKQHAHAAPSGNNLSAAEKALRARHNAQTLENLRAWQKHYKKAFPTFVFYFDGLPDELRHKCARQIHALGATQEKFFSKAVTHVVTARPIPPEFDASSTYHNNHANDADNANKGDTSYLATVNPSMLEKTREAAIRFDSRSANNDVLHRAREMRMKIWAWEKVQRVISTINDPGTALMAASGIYRPSTAKRTRDTDLSLALQNERLNASIDPAREIVPFKGPYIYVHCALETYRPIMVKEYPKVARKNNGSWPQFRSAMAGKCPFIEDAGANRQTARELERKNLLRAHQLEAEKKRLSKIGKTKTLVDERKEVTKQPSLPEMKDMPVPELNSPTKRAWARFKSDDLVNTEHLVIVSRYRKEHGRLPEGGIKALRPPYREEKPLTTDEIVQRKRAENPELYARYDAARKAEEEAKLASSSSELMCTSDMARAQADARAGVESTWKKKKRRRAPMTCEEEQERNKLIKEKADAARAMAAAKMQQHHLKRPAPDDKDDTPRFQKPTSNHLLERLAAQNKSLGLHGLSNAREPAASGVQPSNITSAIRSQMISSTAAGTGAKAATSKEVHELKRKVLENNISKPLAIATNRPTTSSHYPPGSLLEAKLKGVLAPKGPSQAKTAQQLRDESTRRVSVENKGKSTLDEVENDWARDRFKAMKSKQSAAAAKRTIPTTLPARRERREPKPGYCENCRDKFDDFEEHIASRKHRKFAMTSDNWTELDHILDYIHSAQYQNMAQRSVTTWEPSDDEEAY